MHITRCLNKFNIHDDNKIYIKQTMYKIAKQYVLKSPNNEHNCIYAQKQPIQTHPPIHVLWGAVTYRNPGKKHRPTIYLKIKQSVNKLVYECKHKAHNFIKVQRDHFKTTFQPSIYITHIFFYYFYTLAIISFFSTLYT